MIESLLSSRPAWIQLGLVLAHFLWQGAAIAVVLAAVLWLVRRRSPNTRYGLCGLAMLVMAVSPILTLRYVRTHPLPILTATEPSMPSLPVSASGELGATGGEAEEVAPAVVDWEAPAIGEQGASVGDGGATGVVQNVPEPASSVAGTSALRRLWFARGLQLITVAWCAGVLMLSTRLVVGWWRLRRQYRRQTEGLPEAIEAIVRRLSGRLGIVRRIHVVAARVWNEPIAFGLLRPVVLMPIAVLTQCPMELIEAMIAHELAHIRRYDLWVNMFQRVIETLLFYHPAVWWVSGRMRLERELCCDDLAIHATGRRADYATALVELCRMSPGLVTPAMAAGIFGPKLSLLTRVRRVLQVSARTRESNRGRFWLAGPLSVLLAGTFLLVACFHAAPAQEAVAAQPSATQPAAAQRPEEKKTYTFNWNRQPLPKVLAELQEKTGLSVVGADDIERAENWTINFTSTRPVGFDEALLLVNHLIQDKGPGYWILRRDQCLEIRDVVNWFRRIPPAQMFTTEEAYRKANLPKWEVASVVYQPRHASAKSLADRAMDEVPDNTARARPTPDGDRVELKGIVEYIDQQLEIIRKWDVPEDDGATVLRLGKAADTPGRSFYGSWAGTPEDSLATSYSSYSSRSAGPPSVPVHAGADGLIVEVKVKNGQAVKKGDLLARFDDEEVKIDRAAAEIRFDDCSKKHKRMQAQPNVPAEERERVESAARLAELDVQRCRLRLDRTQIKSPADGVVVGRGAPENDVALLTNQQVKAGELLMYIRPAEQTGSGGTTAPRGRVGATPKLPPGTTRPADFSTNLKQFGAASPWLANTPPAAELENAIREFEASKEELESSEFLTDSHPNMVLLRKRIGDLRKALSQSAARKKVYAQGDGIVAEVKVQDGQVVKKGELLVQLDAEDIRLELEAARVRLSQLQRRFDDIERNRNKGRFDADEYRKAEADWKLAEIEVKRIELRLSRSRITSPADGKARAVEGSLSDLVGKRVTAGDLLLYIAPVDSVTEANTRPSP